MFPESFSDFTFYQKKKDILIYKATDASHQYILKCSENTSPVVRQALLDEYNGLRSLSHPSLPHYYGFKEDFLLPKTAKSALALCMEYCEGALLPALVRKFSLNQLLSIVLATGEVLAYLLDNGILYTDLHPSNILVRNEDTDLQITLLDFTYCYYFLKNPNPPYSLRFSYNLSPNLKGQQLLIQELTFFFHALLELKEEAAGEKFPKEPLPFSLYMLLETGNHPAETLSLQEFLVMLKKCIV